MKRFLVCLFIICMVFAGFLGVSLLRGKWYVAKGDYNHAFRILKWMHFFDSVDEMLSMDELQNCEEVRYIHAKEQYRSGYYYDAFCELVTIYDYKNRKPDSKESEKYMELLDKAFRSYLRNTWLYQDANPNDYDIAAFDYVYDDDKNTDKIIVWNFHPFDGKVLGYCTPESRMIAKYQISNDGVVVHLDDYVFTDIREKSFMCDGYKVVHSEEVAEFYDAQGLSLKAKKDMEWLQIGFVIIIIFMLICGLGSSELSIIIFKR